MASKRKHKKHSTKSHKSGHKKHRRHRRHKKSGIGSIITFRRASGMGALDLGIVLPLLAGSAVAAGTITAVRRLVPTDAGNKTGQMLVKFAPVLGAGAGILTSIGWGMMKKRPSERDLGIAAAVVTGLGFMAQDMFALKQRAGEITAALHGIGAIVPQIAGMNAVVPELSGITVLEPMNTRRPDSLGGAYGATPQFAGIDTSAFGTSAYHA